MKRRTAAKLQPMSDAEIATVAGGNQLVNVVVGLLTSAIYDALTSDIDTSGGTLGKKMENNLRKWAGQPPRT